MSIYGFPVVTRPGTLRVIRTFSSWTGSSSAAIATLALGPTLPGSALLFAVGGDGNGGYHAAGPSGVRFCRLSGSDVNTSYRGADLWYVPPIECAAEFGASGAGLDASGASGSAYAEAAGVEIFPGGFKGELLEARSTWTGSSSISYTPFPRAYKDRNLFLVVMSGLHAGGAGMTAGPTATPAGPRLASVGTLTGFGMFRYVPGTLPVIGWSWGRASSNTICTSLMR